MIMQAFNRFSRNALLFFVAVLLILQTRTGLTNDSSNFAQISLPRGVKLEIPKGWWLRGSEYDQVIETTIESVMDLSNLKVNKNSQRITLISAHASPPPLYALAKVESLVPVSISPDLVSSATSSDIINYYKEEMIAFLNKSLPIQGIKLIEFLGVSKETLSGYPAFVTEYRRSGPQGIVRVQINQIFTAGHEVDVTLAYRESEAAFWKPVIAKIRQSLVVAHWVPTHRSR